MVSEWGSVNPHKDLVILRSEYAGREYHFARDEGDQLLHCRLKTTSGVAMLATGVSFYRPNEMPTEREGTLPSIGSRPWSSCKMTSRP